MNAKVTGDGPVVIDVVEASATWRQDAAKVAAPLWLKELLAQSRGLQLRSRSLGLSRPVCRHFTAPPER